MPIPASYIVQVNVGTISAGANNLDFHGLMLTKNQTLPIGAVYSFADVSGVQEYFGYESDEASLATIYFLGYDGAFKMPTKLNFSRFADTAQAAWLRGAKVTDTVDELKSSVGTLVVTMNGVAENISVTLSSATTYSDIANTIQAALREDQTATAFASATVTYSSQFGAFTITNGDTGDDSTIAYASGELAETLNLTEELGAVLSAGTDAVGYTETMAGITNVDSNWVNFMTVWTPTEDDVLGFAQWSNDQGVDYLFLYGDDSPTLLISNSTATISQSIVDANLTGVAGCYDNQDYAAFLMAIGASIDWSRNNGLVTTAFKSQSGLAANVQTGTNALNLEAQKMNFMGNFATRNDQFVFNFPGVMFGDDYGYIDTYWSAVWIKNQIQAACMSGLTSVGRVPYTEQGYTIIRAWIMDVVNRGLLNGVISAGVTLSEAQKAQVLTEVGKDVSAQIYADGYYLAIEDPGADARVNRESPTIYFYFTYAGAVHKLVVPVRMIL